MILGGVDVDDHFRKLINDDSVRVIAQHISDIDAVKITFEFEFNNTEELLDISYIMSSQYLDALAYKHSKPTIAIFLNTLDTLFLEEYHKKVLELKLEYLST